MGGESCVIAPNGAHRAPAPTRRVLCHVQMENLTLQIGGERPRILKKPAVLGNLLFKMLLGGYEVWGYTALFLYEVSLNFHFIDFSTRLH